MQSDRLWYRSDGDTIEQFLGRFAELGAQVAFDPSINASIEADIEGDKLEDALDRILSHLGYIVTWDVVRAPMQDLFRVKSITVFKPGRRRAALPLSIGDKREVVLRNGDRFIANEVLIGFKKGSRRSDVEALLAELDGTIVDCVESLGIYRIRFNPGSNVLGLVERLRRSDMVAGAEPNYVTSLPKTRSDLSDYGKMEYNSIDPHAGGAGGGLAILDSGIDPAMLPSGLVADSYDAIQPGNAASDEAGHGTHMAMIASGLVHPNGIKSGTEYAAPPLLAIKTFDSEGNTSNYDLMRAIDYALDSGAKVINLSWGSAKHSDFIATAVSHAQGQGAVVVAAAGNDPTGEDVYPAAYSGVLAVAATESDGTQWDKSNYGEFVFASAPGTATLPSDGDGRSGSYAGTSIASALTSGAIARYYAKNPAATPQEVITRLKGALSPNPEGETGYGAGRLDSDALQRFLEDR